MYQVFIVEDETLIRQNIRSIIDRMNDTFTLCGEASDGELALSMLQDLSPDILLTDIRMPFLDGFELIRHAKTMLPYVKVIIISGWDDFEYAQRAIALGVDRYLLKPVSAADLMRELLLLRDEIEDEKKKVSANTQKGDEVHEALCQRFMQRLLYGSMDTMELVEEARRLDIDIVHPFYRTVLFRFEAEDADIRSLHAMAEDVLRRRECGLYYFGRHDQLIAVLCDSDEEGLNENVYNLINVLRREVKEICPTVTVINGTVVRRISAISESYRSLISLSEKIAPVSAGRVIESGDMAQLAMEFSDTGNVFSDRFCQKVQNAQMEELGDILDGELAQARERPDNVQMRRYTLIELLKKCVTMIGTFVPDADEKDIAEELSRKHDLFNAPEKPESFRETARSLLEEVVRSRDENASYVRHSHVISRARQYAAENFCDPNISLISAANYVSLSPAHFSMLFSQTVGKTFIAYLTNLRMEKAKQLLRDTDMKLTEIAMSIGYNEPNYFSHVFKKTEGLTPKEYRQGIRPGVE